MNSVIASAPANIALIKYMGKVENSGNRPTNASISFALNHLRTFVRLTKLAKKDVKPMSNGTPTGPSAEARDQWQPLVGHFENYEMQKLSLSEKAQNRFLAHFADLKNTFGIEDVFLIESANNFPSDCGLASSASSFAALTIAAVRIFEKDVSDQEISSLSRRGSGSSCRSLFSPWALWREGYAEKLQGPYPQLRHHVVIVESQKKEVSSSEAHRRVLSSELFNGRVIRAEKRLVQSLEAMLKQDWRECFQIFWAEFWDMHSLFQTAKPAFGYMLPGSLEVLQQVEAYWRLHNDGPWVTMDAGANVHLLYREDQVACYEELGQEFRRKYRVLQSHHSVDAETT